MSPTARGSVRSVRRPRLLAATAAVLALAASACTTPSQNFQKQTEEYLEESDAVRSEFGEVTDAACERPDGTDVGTTYRCTASTADDGTVTFRIQITAEDEFSIVGFTP